MGFFTPWFLAGVAAVGLPVWLHLLRKHRNTPQPFSSLMFFERRTQSSVKHKRLRYLVLFSLRALLLALLALAFAHPYISQTILPHSRSGEITVLAIDNSLSMQAAGRMAEAKQMAKAAIGRLHPGERGQVLAFGSRVAAMSEVSDDHSTLDAGVDAIQASDARTSFAELARSLRSISQSLHLPLRVVLYSDMQQSGMPSNFNDLRLNADIRLEPHALESKPTPNFAVENVVVPNRVYDGSKTRVLATVSGFDTGKSVHNVSLVLNGRTIETKPVEIPEGGRATVEFFSMEVPYGRNKGSVTIDSGDPLAADNTFYFSVERGDPRHVLFAYDGSNNRALVYVKAALDSQGQSAFVLDPVAVDQTANLAPVKYAFVIVSDVGALPPEFEKHLRDYVSSGGSVLVALGHNSAGLARVPVGEEPILGTRYAGREGDLFQTAASLDTSHPSIGQSNHWDEVKFYRALRIDPGKGRIAARLTDDTPLLVDQQLGAGHVLVFASTLDNVDNDFPVHASFVPFLVQTAQYLARQDNGPSSVMVDSFEELRDSHERGAAVDVMDPKGDRVFSLSEAAKAQNIQFTQAGFYDIRRPNGRNELVAVNTDRLESDLTPAPAETLTLWQNTASGAAAAEGTSSAEQKPLSLWWYVMLAVLVLAIAESLLGNRHLSVDKEAA
jgi:hypothetical protein